MLNFLGIFEINRECHHKKSRQRQRVELFG